MAVLMAFFVAFGVVAEETKKPEENKDKTADLAAAAANANAEPAKDKKKVETPVALTMEGIQELDDRKKSLDARERELDERAKTLEVQEKVLREKLRRMEELNKKMAERLDGFKKNFEEKLVKLVTVVETMKPQSAAEYVENLDPDLAVEILARIQVAKAAKIMNLVDKKKSARLTEMYTGYRQNSQDGNSAPTPEAAKPTAKEATPNKM